MNRLSARSTQPAPSRPARRRSLVLTVSLLAALAGAAPALAQHHPPRGPQSGPQTGSQAPKHTTGARAIDAHEPAFPMFMRHVRALQPGRVPEGLELTPEQSQLIEKVHAAHQQTLLAYVQLHRAEMESLLGKAELPPQRPMDQESLRLERPERRERDAREPGRRGPERPDRPERERRDGARDQRSEPTRSRPDGVGSERLRDTPEAESRQQALRLFAQLAVVRQADGISPQARAARQRLIELRDGAPSPDEAQRVIWDMLTPEQRAHVTASIEKAMAQRSRERDGDARPEGPRARPDAQRERPDGPGRDRGPGERDRRPDVRERRGPDRPRA
jgi:hypothetical protein